MERFDESSAWSFCGVNPAPRNFRAERFDELSARSFLPERRAHVQESKAETLGKDCHLTESGSSVLAESAQCTRACQTIPKAEKLALGQSSVILSRYARLSEIIWTASTNFSKPLYGDIDNRLHGAVLTQIPDLFGIALRHSCCDDSNTNLAHELHLHANVRIRQTAPSLSRK